jgi:hypothetical protein
MSESIKCGNLTNHNVNKDNKMRVLLTVVFYSIVFACLISGIAFTQDNIIIPDLSKIESEDGWVIFNRSASLIKEKENVAVSFNSQEGDGIAWLEDIEFGDGIIEIDIKGKDVPGNSFVGVAFHGLDDRTYDAVYFRPFNFKSEDPVRKRRAVQYISHPEYTWSKLRHEYPDEYENSVYPVPDPDSFFHAKIVVEKPRISVYVNHSENPSLVVTALSDRNNGWVGLWVGNYSDGTFANLKIIGSTK